MALADKFGGSESLHSKIFLELIDRLVYFFARYIEIPTNAQAQHQKMLLKR